jgi:adenine-specific DNA-methyltransferase
MNIYKGYDELKKYYNETLNKDKSLVKTSNDEPTPIECIEEMFSKINPEFWSRKNLKILDPCCGCGNFFLVIYNYLIKHHSHEDIITKMLYFNDINEDRLQIVRNIFDNNKQGIFNVKGNLNITKQSFLEYDETDKYDMVVANPPFAKLLPNGKRASKNHNLIGSFIKKTLAILKEGGILVYITPDNWMSCADRNTLIKVLTSKQIHYLNIHTAKKYFKKIGSSFTWYIIENTPSYKDITIEGIWKNKIYTDTVESEVRRFIPLFYNRTIQSILHKTVDRCDIKKFAVETTSYLHKYTKRDCISKNKDDVFKYRLIHTPRQTVYANKKHKFQDGWKVFISTTTRYSNFVDNCGMTQSIAFIRCKDKNEADNISKVLDHPLYKFINNICRYGNFNNIRILQSFPYCDDYDSVYKKMDINNTEIEFIESNV